MSLLTVLLSFVVAVGCTSNSGTLTKTDDDDRCAGCQLSLIETIPIGMEPYDNLRHMSTFDGWKQLLQVAHSKIEIASFYWTLQDEEYPHASSREGKEIYGLIMEAGTQRGIDVRITKAMDTQSFPNLDTKAFVAAGAAQVRDVNFTALVGSGILHTKMWVVDRKHVYIGSSNFDWRALSQVKEIGLLGMSCPCLGEDLGKTFDVYWELGSRASLPEEWGPEFQVVNNKEFPLFISDASGQTYDAYVASSPPEFCPNNRTTDLDAIFEVIDNAQEFIHVAVMTYATVLQDAVSLRFWPDLEYRLKSAAMDRRVKVKLMSAQWSQTSSRARKFLRSLENLDKTYEWVDIQVKMFEVDSTPDQANIPFSRVNHNKYVVTESSAYIGTSNWSGDYFVYTGGVSVVFKPTGAPVQEQDDIRKQLEKVFERDWNSSYAHELWYYEDGGSNSAAVTRRSTCTALGILFLSLTNIIFPLTYSIHFSKF